MIFDFDRQVLFAFPPRKSLRHGPGFQDPFHLEPKIVMQPARIVFLNDKTRRALDQLRQGLSAFRLGGLSEIAFPLVFAQSH